MDHRFRKFLAVAETGSFSAAAKKLHVTQPAITLAIGSLERAFGTKLYLRKKYAVELTPQGEIVAAAAKKIALAIDKMESSLQESITAQPYRVGIIDSIAYLLYGSAKNADALSDIDVMVDNSQHILDDISDDKIDGGVITGQPTTLDKGLTVRKLRSEEFVFVAAPNKVSTKLVTQIDDWLAINQESTSYRHFVKLFRRKGLTVTPIFYSTSMELLKQMAIGGKGTALLPRHMVEEALEAGTLGVLNTKPLYRPIWAVMRKKHGAQSLSVLSRQVDQLLTDHNP